MQLHEVDHVVSPPKVESLSRAMDVLIWMRHWDSTQHYVSVEASKVLTWVYVG